MKQAFGRVTNYDVSEGDGSPHCGWDMSRGTIIRIGTFPRNICGEERARESYSSG
ncbi:hypothetical protein [Methylocystis sp.]|uniref:hypothetical protein n=1 Tax=Methylocystis sp. TaxID=1911079 RepID=UPI0027375D96|nr:hypothetical protein [Methylocystis sp.]MDP3553280.1 hypothetical protein [Methylocystis sp.]